jgi:hypothetical protein
MSLAPKATCEFCHAFAEGEPRETLDESLAMTPDQWFELIARIEHKPGCPRLKKTKARKEK